MENEQKNNLRSQSQQNIKQGDQIFYSKTDIKDKEKGLKIFIEGIEQLIQYCKLEGNLEIQNEIKQKIKSLIEKGEKMKKQMNINQNQLNQEKQEGQTHFYGSLQEDNSNIEKLDQIIGLDEQIKILKESVYMPFKFPQIFQVVRIIRKNILIFGPTGVGKTLLVNSCLQEFRKDCNFSIFKLTSKDLLSQYPGEGKQRIKDTFTQALNNQPSIIFFDEIDSFGKNIEEGQTDQQNIVGMQTQFLIQLQSICKQEQLLVIATTNQPWILLPSIRRRFDNRIYITLPDINSRLQLLKKYMNKKPNIISPYNYDQLAQKMQGYSPQDILNFTNQLLLQFDEINNKQLNDDILAKQKPQEYNNFQIQKKQQNQINNDVLQKFLNEIPPSASEEIIQKYQAYYEKFIVNAEYSNS